MRTHRAFVKTRRALAKAIDLLAFAGFLSLGVRWFDSTWAGFALGAAYLLTSDALGMSAKNWFHLGVIDVNTGHRCSIASSILRNTPWLAAPLFRTALASFHDASAGAPAPAYGIARGVVGVIGLGVAVTLWRGLGDGSGRHWADVFAGTKVLSLKPGEAVRMPRARTAAPAKGGVRTTGEHDAVDFDDAADDRPAGKADDGAATTGGGRPARPKADPRPVTRDRDAVDFDDAN